MRRFWKILLAVIVLAVIATWSWNTVSAHWFEPVHVEERQNREGEEEYFADFSLRCRCTNPFHRSKGHGERFRLAVQSRLEQAIDEHAGANGLRHTTTVWDGKHRMDREDGDEGCNETLRRLAVFKRKY